MEVELKGLSESIWTKSLAQNDMTKNTVWLLSAIQNGGNSVRILGILGDKFYKKNLHFRG